MAISTEAQRQHDELFPNYQQGVPSMKRWHRLSVEEDWKWIFNDGRTRNG